MARTMKEVTDPKLLAELEGRINYDFENTLTPEEQSKLDADATREAIGQLKEVTDPKLLAELNGEQEKILDGQTNELAWRDVPGLALKNAPSSMGGVLKGIGNAVIHPIDSARNVFDITSGGVQNALPESVISAISSINPNRENAELARKKAAIVGEFYKNRYGTEQGFKEALAYDPASVLMDASAVVGGAGGLANKAGLNGSSLVNVSRKIDPVLQTTKAAKYGADKLGSGLANVIGGIGTHTGAESLKAAARAGLEGGAKQADFVDNMRGNADFMDMLPPIKNAIRKMRADRGAEYRAGMAAVGQNPTVIPMTDIKATIDDAMNIKRFKGESISPTTEGIQADIQTQFERWSQLNPSEYHTAEGLDAFKQVIGDIRDSTAPNTPQRAVASRVYDAVKSEIIKQEPKYAEVMADYEKATKLTNEIEKSLSQGEKASADTAIRKLQSLTRNNVNTNYGNRLKLAQELEANGADNLTEKLAGQALSTWTPRGLGGLSAMGTGSYGLYYKEPLTIPLLAMQSPRLMGEAALLTGQAANMAGKGGNLLKDASLNLGISPEDLTKIIYQTRDRKKQ